MSYDAVLIIRLVIRTSLIVAGHQTNVIVLIHLHLTVILFIFFIVDEVIAGITIPLHFSLLIHDAHLS
jgi:hypothetical protein